MVCLLAVVWLVMAGLSCPEMNQAELEAWDQVFSLGLYAEA